MATSKKLTRDEQMVRSAKVRAAIIALVRETPQISTTEVIQSLSDLMKATKASRSSVITQLKQMVKNGQLLTEHGHRPLRFTLPAENGRTKKITVKGKKGEVPNFTIDIIKSTGRVRLQLGGLSIEIGVVDE